MDENSSYYVRLKIIRKQSCGQRDIITVISIGSWQAEMQSVADISELYYFQGGDNFLIIHRNRHSKQLIVNILLSGLYSVQCTMSTVVIAQCLQWDATNTLSHA